MLMMEENIKCEIRSLYFSKLPCHDFVKLWYEPDTRVNNICIFHYSQRTSKYHEHDFFELAYVADGKIIHHIGNDKIEVSAGDYFFVNYTDIHKYTVLSDDCADIINCCFLPHFINPSMNGCQDFNELLKNYPFFFFNASLTCEPTRHIFHDDDGKIKSLLEEMIVEYNSAKTGNNALMRGYLSEIIIRSVRKIQHNDSPIKDETVLMALRYAEDNIHSSEISLNKIAEELNVSRQYLSRRFKQETNMTFTEYMKKLRINYCCHLLCTSDRSITEIAQQSGYNDMKSFYQAFKNQMNMTPLEFKKTSKID